MQSKKFLVGNVFLALAGTLVFSLAAISKSGNNYFDARGEYTPYSIVLETNKNKIGTEAFSPTVAHSGNGTATTELGNSVAFEYNSIYNPTTYWQTIKAGGYITNTQPIMGMSRLTLTKNSSDASFGIYWSNTSTFVQDRYELFDSLSPLEAVCDFDGSMPNYMKIVALSDSSILSGLIEFSCVDSYPTLAFQEGTYAQYGAYPQIKVTDLTLQETLNSAAGPLPSSSNAQAWSDYGYYISGTLSSYMWYIDLVHETDRYRGVYFTSYRPGYTVDSSLITKTYQDENGYNTSMVYWFKFEPIAWKVLDVQAGKAFLMAARILDAQDIYPSMSNRTVGPTTIYPNNYEYSHIRSWLNDSFYNTAFTSVEKVRIQTTTVDNSAASAGYSSLPYACNSTNDKVFLMSYQELNNPIYGLNNDMSRQINPSAYAQSQGAYYYYHSNPSMPFGDWWLRSPYDSSTNSWRVSFTGAFASTNNTVTKTSNGVVPAMWISTI